MPRFPSLGLIVAATVPVLLLGICPAVGQSVRPLRVVVGEAQNPAQQPPRAVLQLGGQGGYSDDSVLRARRTAIGQDTSGRILLVVASSGTFTLAEMSQFLLNSDFDLAVALNLDGGASSGLLLREPSEGIPAFSLLPTVITIRPKPAPD